MITILWYGVNLLAVPLLALVGRWEMAAFLIVAECLGKAIRAPSREAMLSHASRQVGRGLGFGLYETLDQIGAVSGPLIVAAVLYLRGGRYQPAFAALFLPAMYSRPGGLACFPFSLPPAPGLGSSPSRGAGPFGRQENAPGFLALYGLHSSQYRRLYPLPAHLLPL